MSMKIRRLIAPAAAGLALLPFSLQAQNDKDEFDPFSDAAAEALVNAEQSFQAYRFLEPGQVRELTEKVKPSLVTIRQMGRDGKKRGTGSGFIVSEDGLVVTNFHVIGEGRSIEVEMSDGSKYDAVSVHASDQKYDLAVVKIDTEGKKLPPLKVGDSSLVKQGDLIVGFGTPQGLAFSVVPGVISAIRKLEPGFVGENDTPEFPMLQLAMPIEQGNSGGPVINLKGEVLGVVTLKHRVTENLGFAVPSNDLTTLLEKPNPVPIERWRTIGNLDPKQWTPIMGGDWSQRGGIISARHLGDGFGGRTMCLSSLEIPEVPYEVAVRVRLDDEGGAAGLMFESDGGDVHYGFYPSGGSMRLTRFEGPDVYSWSILEQFEASSYRPGDWNRLRVRVEADKIVAWINGEKVLETEDSALRGGKVGLCKFRRTVAEFRGFHVGNDLSEKAISDGERMQLTSRIESFLKDGISAEMLSDLVSKGHDSRELIQAKVEELESLVVELNDLKEAVHRGTVINELLMALDRPESEIDLFEIGLQIARIDDPEMDVEHYREMFSGLVNDARSFVKENAGQGGAMKRAEALRDYLFKEQGFHGSRSEYYHHSNSYVNHVLDDREGLPITLSVLFVEMARRLGIPGVYGASFPGKFMVGIEPESENDKTMFVDVYEGGAIQSRSKAARMVWEMLGAPPGESAFDPAPAKAIAVRMLRNLVDIEVNQQQTPVKAKNYIEILLAIEPDSAQERFQRALLRVQDRDYSGAKEDLDWLLENRPPGIDYSRLEQFRDSIPIE